MLPGRPHEGESPGGPAEAPREMAAERASARYRIRLTGWLLASLSEPAPACYGRRVRRVIAIGAAAVVAAGAVTLGLALTTGGPGAQKPGVVATSAPLQPVRGSTLDGTSFGMGDYFGHVLVLNFWNPYCGPCRGEATVLDLAEGNLAPEGVVIAGVLFSDDSFPHDVVAAKRFVRVVGERFPTIDDASGSLASTFSIRGIPTTVIADASGTIRYEVFGALKTGELERLVRRVQRR